jgi:predicted ATP-grasp superfamily ATP-dependent carboligase
LISNDKVVIIGFADALSAPEVAFSLLDAGYNVAAFFRRNSKPPALSKCKEIRLIEITAPEEDVYKAVAELKDIYKTLRSVAIMPLNDGAVWLCDNLAEDKSIKVAGATGNHARFSLDKRIQIKAALESGFNVPETIVIEKVENAQHLEHFPIVLKPAIAFADECGKPLKKQRLQFCINKQEFNTAISLWDGRQPLLAQSVHHGVGEGLFGFATDRGIMAWSAHSRVRMMNPKGSGSSACKAIPTDNHPLKEAESMLLKIGWRGMFMIELLRDINGKRWFIEVNGRPWGSMALARRMGFEYPAWSILQIFDPAFSPIPSVSKEYFTCRHLGREIIHILQVLRGPSSRAIPNWPSFWRTLFTIMRVDNNDRWYNWNPRYKALFISDTYETVMNETIRKFIKL